MRPVTMILLGSLLILPGCRRQAEPERLDAKKTAAMLDQIARAPEYKPPVDGRLTPRQVGMYVAVHRREQDLRKRNPSTVDLLVARDLGYDPKEYAWVRDRVLDAEMLQTTRTLSLQVAQAREAILATLRKQREAARSAGERAEIDRQIRELETPTGKVDADPAREANAALLTEARHGK
jgi:hypothetical protein